MPDPLVTRRQQRLISDCVRAGLTEGQALFFDWFAHRHDTGAVLLFDVYDRPVIVEVHQPCPVRRRHEGNRGPHIDRLIEHMAAKKRGEKVRRGDG